MASWITYKGLDVPDSTVGQGGTYLKDDLTDLADRAPYASTSNPTVSDDSGDGFGVGSLWLRTDERTMWICTDASSGAAKWRPLFKRVENAIILAPVAGVGGGDDAQALQLDDSGNLRGASAVDLQRNRSASTQVASGTQSAIVGGENNTAFSIGSVVMGGKGNNAGGGSGTISSISNTGNPTTITTSANHGLLSGQSITISDTSTSPNSVNGTRTAQVTSSNTFTVAVNVTSVTTGTGNWTTHTSAAYAFVAGGENNRAVGKRSNAEGRGTTAIGAQAHSEGLYTTARSTASHAEGGGTLASGIYSHAEGNDTTASAFSAHAEGDHTLASGDEAHAEGRYAIASGLRSHAEGYSTTASGDATHAEGYFTTASGDLSHAEGRESIASGYISHAGGCLSKARLQGQWARASGAHSNGVGTAQTTITQLFRSTTNATATELTLDGNSPGGSNLFVISDGQTLSCFINVVGRKIDADSSFQASFLRQACICREGSSTQLVDTAKTVGTDIKPGGWDVAISADDTNESLKIEVTGAASTSIRWMATVIGSEVADAAI